MKKVSGKPENGGLDLKDMDSQLAIFEKRLETLKQAFDQYFSGIAKRAPLKDLDDFRTSFGRIAPQDVRSTAHRFKHQTIKTRFIQLNALWQKNLRAIEEGTFKRDIFLLKAKQKEDAPQTSVPNTASSAPKVSGIDQQIQQLYEKFAALTQATQQKLPSKEGFIKTLKTQIEAQRTKNPSAKLELKLQKDETGKFQVKLKVNK